MRSTPATARPVTGLPLFAVLLVAALAATMTAPAAAGTPPADGRHGTIWTAAVTMTVRSTSDHATLTVDGLEVLHSRVRPGDTGDVRLVDGGIQLVGDGRPVAATVDMVVAGDRTATQLPVRLTRGDIGEASGQVAGGGDLPDGPAATDLTVSSPASATSLTDPLNTVTGVWDVAALTDRAVPTLPRRTDDRQVLAFYYPWFGSYDDPRTADRPADPRPTDLRQAVDAMAAQATSHGVDGWVVSWAGAAADGHGYDLAADAMAGHGGHVTGYLEVAAATGSAPTPLVAAVTVRRWLAELSSRWDHPAQLTLDGTPVVFAFAVETLPAVWWPLATAGLDVVLVGDTTSAAFADVVDADHSYAGTGSPADRADDAVRRAVRHRAAALLDPTVPARLHVETVAPGYDDRAVRQPGQVIGRDGGDRYDDLWEVAVATDPDWVVVTSWNEWFEGTSIEPGVAEGDRALRQTAGWAATFTAR